MSNGRTFEFFMVLMRPLASFSMVVSVRLMYGISVCICLYHISLHLSCIFVLIRLLSLLHWKRWSPFVSKFWLQRGHFSFSVVSQMFIRRQRRRLNLKSRLLCLLSLSLLGRSMSPWPIFPSSISSMLCLLSLGR